MLVARLIVASLALLAGLAAAWWLAGRLEERQRTSPFLRLLIAAGLACVGYLSVVNLAGRLIRQSTIPATVFFIGCAVAAVWLWRRKRAEMDVASLWSTRNEWAGVLAIAVVVALPQLLLAVSTPYWDEVASSAIHLTAAN